MPTLHLRNLDDDDRWWYSDSGVIIRYVIFSVIVVVIFGYIFGGYLHARSRVRKGLRPLAYHRCLIGQRRPNTVQYGWAGQQYGQPGPGGYYQPGQYRMQDMPPPPVYDPSRPPVYEPPEGASKVDPSQWRTEPTRRPDEASGSAPDYSAPPGPPPSAAYR